ncbi:hypothetical protein ElyMa_004576700 [Elysia marginata]|uniref:Uncharacterized protein n=1 Tax=Elysia marginata TaxID=1093978 RepID=A0AAV4HXN4_9GAST|nr:hypothetical protein ElyMa_004576700 [Elysia marginata]
MMSKFTAVLALLLVLGSLVSQVEAAETTVCLIVKFFNSVMLGKYSEIKIWTMLSNAEHDYQKETTATQSSRFGYQERA